MVHPLESHSTPTNQSTMKVLTCSRFFPKGHPKAGQPTHFVEKIEACLADTIPGWEMSKTFALHDWEPYYNCTMPKGHTIRAGNRFKVGDMASLRVWSDKPYRSKQVEFCPGGSEEGLAVQYFRWQLQY